MTVTGLHVLHGVELVGGAVFAISGALAAGRRSLDLVGVVVIALVTAAGGGTLRDLLLDRTVFWIADPSYLYVSLAAALLTVLYTRIRHPPDRLILYADALGLALFSIGGAQIAESLGHGGIVVIIMGAATGVAGGLLRDVLCAEIPLILRRGRMYASASVAGVAAYLLLEWVVDRTVAALLGMAVIAALRVAAIVWDLTVPVFSLPRHDEEQS
ncbi:MAG: trimeric intracellular cation channel family protein [Pseudomonadota bacterium]